MAFIQTENLFSISGVALGKYTFEINPENASHPESMPDEFNEINVIDGANVLQFPTDQKHLTRTMQWPYVSYQIYENINSYSVRDADGTIPTSYLWYPGGYVSGLPIKIKRVWIDPLTATDPQRYRMELEYILV